MDRSRGGPRRRRCWGRERTTEQSVPHAATMIHACMLWVAPSGRMGAVIIRWRGRDQLRLPAAAGLAMSRYRSKSYYPSARRDERGGLCKSHADNCLSLTLAGTSCRCGELFRFAHGHVRTGAKRLPAGRRWLSQRRSPLWNPIQSWLCSRRGGSRRMHKSSLFYRRNVSARARG